jgi:sigma-B regulation protein RsbU (phosphoserine phosphatase)
MTRLSIRQKIILLVLALNIALTAILSYTGYQNEREAVLRGIDEKLFSGATGLGELFPADYHAKITGPGTVPDDEYKSYVARLTDLARRNKFQWLYTYMEQNGQIVTTATSADLKDPSKVVAFLTPYQQPSDRIRRAFSERKPYFDEYTDEFGPVRSAFVPFVTPNGKVFVAGADVSIDFIDDMLNGNFRKTMLISALVSIGFVLLSVVVANRMSRPIGELASLTESMGERQFSLTDDQAAWLQRVSQGSRDEVGELASAFRQMDGMLKQYIANLKETTAAKERIESELNIARSIQDSFLHKLFPPFPDRPEFDLFATLMPAKEVGGDLYDFVLVGDELYFCVGDVSDKGVPAALLMVVTQTLMRAAAQEPNVDPAAMLLKVNADILEKNEMLMFVTLFCGVLNLKTGELRFSNAGHNPPLIRKRSGEVEWLTLPDGMVLGVMPDVKYATSRITLKPGDTLLAYTDGVTEAHAPSGALYSDEKLIGLVRSESDLKPIDLVPTVMKSVKAHASTAPQSDDITILALRFGRS